MNKNKFMNLSILEKSAIRKRVPAISIEGYHEFFRLGFIPEKTELIEGVVVEKIPKDPMHAGLVQKIVLFFIRNLPEQFDVRQENPLSLIDSEPEPDIAIVDKDEHDYLQNHPAKAHLVIEVANSSLNYDRDKLSMYAKGNIPEVWIINLQKMEVEVYSEPSNSKYNKASIIGKKEQIEISLLENTSFSLADFIK